MAPHSPTIASGSASPGSRSQSPAPSKLSSKSYESLTSHPLLDEDDDLDGVHEADTSAAAVLSHNEAAGAGADTSVTESITSPGLSGLSTSGPTSIPAAPSRSPSYNVHYKTRQRPPSFGSTAGANHSHGSLAAFSQPSQASVATTTSTSVTSPLPSASSGQSNTLTNKLQSQNLQASAQAAGLSADSAGWLMLQKLVNSAEKEVEKDKSLANAVKALRMGKVSCAIDQPCKPKLRLVHLHSYMGKPRLTGNLSLLGFLTFAYRGRFKQ